MSAELPPPRTEAGAAGLAALLAQPSRSVVAVDFDGTLAPIVERPADARPQPGALAALAALVPIVAACAVVTGRSAADVMAIGGVDAVAGLHVLGHYGLEEWYDGRLQAPAPMPAIDDARRALAGLVASAPDGVHLEDKQHSLTVHTRPAVDPQRVLDALVPEVAALADRLGLETVPGRYTIEVRPAGVDKGLAVRRLADECDAHVVVYIGDDLGDLPAFDAVEQLREEGRAGLTVASLGADAPAEIAARADLVLDGPSSVVAFLERLSEQAQRQTG